MSSKSGPNRSTAVMQRRKSTAPNALDYYPTPPFATRALAEFLVDDQCFDLSAMSCWEPACGEGHMARPLAEAFEWVRVSDVHRYFDGHELLDFVFFADREPAVDFVVSNPPFKLAQAFIETALKVASRGVAMLVRSAFLEGQDRHSELFTRTPPTYVLQFVERVVMLEGRLVKAGAVDPYAEKPGTKASSATAYCWLVWLRDGQASAWTQDTRLRWIAPCRDRLEKPGDYPDYVTTAELPPDGLFGGLA